LALALLVATVTFVKMPTLISANLVSQTAATLVISPTTALPNQYIAVTGEDFTVGGAATISTISLGGSIVDTGKINFGAPVNVDSSGKFVTNLVVPVNSITLTPGSYSMAATDSGGKTAAATLVITAPTISLSPVSSRAGSTITVTGANFPLNSTNIGTDQVPPVTINYNITTSNAKQVASIFPDSLGAFTTTFEVPLSATIPSTANKVSTAIPGTSATATATHSVTKPLVTASPIMGPPGTVITITGTEFNSFIQVKSLSIGGIQVEIPANLITDSAGKFTLSSVVPTIENGTQPILAQAGTSTYTVNFSVTGSSATASTTQTVTTKTTYQLTQELSPLGDNLLRVYRFHNVDKKWTFYDPKPEFASFITLTELATGNAYWIKVKRGQTTVIGGTYRDLFEGWNLVAW